MMENIRETVAENVLALLARDELDAKSTKGALARKARHGADVARSIRPYLPALTFIVFIALSALYIATRPPPKPISPEMAEYIAHIGGDKPGQFHGYNCDDPNCSGEKAGYAWASEAFARSPDTCLAKFGHRPLARYHGCMALVEEEQAEPGR